MKKRSLLSLMNARHWGLGVALVAVAGLSGCGGGGGGGGGGSSSSSSTSSTSTTTTTTPPAPTPTLLGGTMQGVALSLAGTPSIYAGASGAKYTKSFNEPDGIATDGTYLYVCDDGNNQIDQIDISTGAIVVLSSSLFHFPYGITTEDGKNLYVANTGDNNIIQINVPDSGFSNATVSVLAGDGTAAEVDGTGASGAGAAEFNNPLLLTTDGTYLYVSDWLGNTIRRVTIASGLVSTLVPVSAGLNGPYGIVIVGAGSNASLYVADLHNNKIRQIHNPASADLSKVTMTSFCGTGTLGITSGSCNTAEFSSPAGMTTDGAYLYVEDDANQNGDIRRIDIANSQVDPLLSSGMNASFYGLTTDGASLFAADANNNDLVEIN